MIQIQIQSHAQLQAAKDAAAAAARASVSVKRVDAPSASPAVVAAAPVAAAPVAGLPAYMTRRYSGVGSRPSQWIGNPTPDVDRRREPICFKPRINLARRASTTRVYFSRG